MARTEDSRPGLPDRDWEGECLDLTRRLIQQDTANPPGNEYRAGEVLAEFLDSAGIDVEVIDPGDGRASVVARVSGDDSGGRDHPGLLLSHLRRVLAGPVRMMRRLWRSPKRIRPMELGWSQPSPRASWVSLLTGSGHSGSCAPIGFCSRRVVWGDVADPDTSG